MGELSHATNAGPPKVIFGEALTVNPLRIYRLLNFTEGGLAQLGERYNGIVEVIGSSPLSSTFRKARCEDSRRAFFVDCEKPTSAHAVNLSGTSRSTPIRRLWPQGIRDTSCAAPDGNEATTCCPFGCGNWATACCPISDVADQN